MLPYSKVFVLMLLPLGVALQHGRPVPPDQARGRCPVQQVRDGACIDSSPEPFFEEVQPQETLGGFGGACEPQVPGQGVTPNENGMLGVPETLGGFGGACEPQVPGQGVTPNENGMLGVPVSCCQLLFIGLPTMDLAPTNSLQDWVGDASSHLVDGMQPLQDAGLSDCDGRTAVIADQLPGRLPPICWHFLRGTCTRGRNCKFTHQEVPQDPQGGVVTMQDVLPQQRQPCWHFQRGTCTRGEKCKFFHPQDPQGGSPEETEDSEDEEDRFALARRRSRQEDNDEDHDRGNSGARSSWE